MHEMIVVQFIKGNLRTIVRYSYLKVYKLITLGTKFQNLLLSGGGITMFSKKNNKLQ